LVTLQRYWEIIETLINCIESNHVSGFSLATKKTFLSEKFLFELNHVLDKFRFNIFDNKKIETEKNFISSQIIFWVSYWSNNNIIATKKIKRKKIISSQIMYLVLY